MGRNDERVVGDDGGSAGFALLELIFGAMVLTLAVGALGMTLARSATLDRSNRESGLALQAAQSALARLRGAPDFAEVFVRYNADPADDPLGAGTAPGSPFEVPGLNVRPGDPDGMAGSIEFPGGGVQLLENVADPELGMPRDLNLDLGVDAVDHAGDYAVLPVRVRVEWTGVSGEREVELVTTLTNWGGAP